MIKKEARCSSAYKFHVRCTVVLFHWAMQSHATRTQMLRYRSETIMTARRMASLVPYTLTPPHSPMMKALEKHKKRKNKNSPLRFHFWRPQSTLAREALEKKEQEEPITLPFLKATINFSQWLQELKLVLATIAVQAWFLAEALISSFLLGFDQVRCPILNCKILL